MNFKIILLTSIFFLIFKSYSQENKYPYQDISLTPEERAEDLLQRLTLEEKALLMQNGSPAIERLGIKAYDWWNEALHGVARAGLATVYPQAIGMAASFNDKLLYDVFTSVSDEARAKSTEFSKNGKLKRYQGLTMWTPNVNIFRDPRWGRGQETYGEDPYLTSRMGIAVVKGLQGPDDSKYDKLHACAKHFAVHSGPEWNRHSFNAENISPRDLWETYLPAFKNLVQKADVKEVMCAYNRFEGEPCCGNNRLLTQILRDEWGFDGIVVSDCWAINDFWTKGNHETHTNKEHAIADAVSSGTDLECGPNYPSLPNAVKEGLITEERIDTSLKRLLKARFELGEMDEKTPWNEIPYSVVDSKEHKELALRMAKESIVLLQNKNNILPLKGNEKIAVVGPNANDSTMQWGNYNGYPSHTITLLEGLGNNIPAENIIYEQGCDRTETTTLKSAFNMCSNNNKPGFKATYWNNTNMEGGPVAVTHVSTPFHFITTGGTTFASGVNIQNFSAKYESTLKPEENADIDFCFTAHAEIKIYIDGKMVGKGKYIKNDESLYTLKAEKGKEYNITIEYVFNNKDRAASLDFDMGYHVPVDLQKSVDKVKNADIIIFAGGISPTLEGEEMSVKIPGFKGGDRTDIELPKIQREFIKKLKESGKKIVYVNFSGSAIGLVPESKNCDAIIQAWYPGQAGGQAIADIITGKYNPAGRLPVTFYKNVEQIPDFEDYSMKGRTYRYMTEKPLFCFGHGLSYTTFEYGTAQTDKNIIEGNSGITLTIPVKNTGNRDGEEVVQVYLQFKKDKEGPSHALRGFKRINVPKGKTVNVDITLSKEDFEWFDTENNSMRPLEGKYTILYGGTSDISKLKGLTVVVK